jgi:uncharacterized protein YfaQ (DUF2300 family)
VPERDETDQLDRAIRAALSEVWARVNEWREAPHWHDDEERYERSAAAVSAADKAEDLAALVDAVRPLLDVWRPNRAGPEQAIFAAVDRIRAAVREAETRD